MHNLVYATPWSRCCKRARVERADPADEPSRSVMPRYSWRRTPPAGITASTPDWNNGEWDIFAREWIGVVIEITLDHILQRKLFGTSAAPWHCNRRELFALVRGLLRFDLLLRYPPTVRLARSAGVSDDEPIEVKRARVLRGLGSLTLSEPEYTVVWRRGSPIVPNEGR